MKRFDSIEPIPFTVPWITSLSYISNTSIVTMQPHNVVVHVFFFFLYFGRQNYLPA